MPESISPEVRSIQQQPDAVRLLSKYGFYLSLALILYAVLFPFRFDLSWQHLSIAWSRAGFAPFWSGPKGLQVTGDDFSNILLTVPLGFFGFLVGSGRKRVWAACKWFVLGSALGLASEFAQLAIPTRSSGITDALNNGVGAALGVILSSYIGRRALDFFTGTATERRNIYLWLLIWSMLAMLGPYDLSQQVLSGSGAGPGIAGSRVAGAEAFIDKAWLHIAGFALIGALAARLAVPGRRKRSLGPLLASVALVLLFPVILHLFRILLDTNPPYLDDLTLDLFGALAGALISLLIPPHLRAFSGFLMFKIAIIAAALNPYNFTVWRAGVCFQWIPFYDFCRNRTPVAFYEATLSLFTFAILGGLLQLSFPRLQRRYVALHALIFSIALEFAQAFLPGRSSGTTDVLMACLGAGIGAYICDSVETSRLNSQWIVMKGF